MALVKTVVAKAMPSTETGQAINEMNRKEIIGEKGGTEDAELTRNSTTTPEEGEGKEAELLGKRPE